MWGPIFTDGQSAKCSQSNFQTCTIIPIIHCTIIVLISRIAAYLRKLDPSKILCYTVKMIEITVLYIHVTINSNIIIIYFK